MNVVNFSDGVDGLAAGVVHRSPRPSFAIIAFDLGRRTPPGARRADRRRRARLPRPQLPPGRRSSWATAARTCSATCWAAITVQGTLKTNALIALVGPLVILAVPFLDTGFVVAKRIKYRRAGLPRRPLALPPPDGATSASRSGGPCSTSTAGRCSWPASRSRCASSPTRDEHGHLTPAGRVVMVALCLLALAASVYLVYVLEILKFRRLRGAAAARARPEATDEHDDRGRRRARARDGGVRGGRALSALRPPERSAPVDAAHPDVAERADELVVGEVGRPGRVAGSRPARSSSTARRRSPRRWRRRATPAACSRSMRRRGWPTKRPMRPRQNAATSSS